MTNVRQCDVPGCSNPHIARGLCTMHYQRERNSGRLGTLVYPETCFVDGCARKPHGHGYCSTHYMNWLRNGDPVGATKAELTQSAFWAKVQKTDTCWLWTGTINRWGYGQFSNQQAHRVCYQWLVGEIPNGWPLDHLCKVRNCVNPAHLEAVTTRENLMRSPTFQAINAAKTQCYRGHPFSPENTRTRYKKGLPYRSCRTCQRENQREYTSRKRVQLV